MIIYDKKIVLKYNTLNKFLDVLIIHFSNISFINVINLS